MACRFFLSLLKSDTMKNWLCENWVNVALVAALGLKILANLSGRANRIFGLLDDAVNYFIRPRKK